MERLFLIISFVVVLLSSADAQNDTLTAEYLVTRANVELESEKYRNMYPDLFDALLNAFEGRYKKEVITSHLYELPLRPIRQEHFDLLNTIGCAMHMAEIEDRGSFKWWLLKKRMKAEEHLYYYGLRNERCYEGTELYEYRSAVLDLLEDCLGNKKVDSIANKYLKAIRERERNSSLLARIDALLGE